MTYPDSDDVADELLQLHILSRDGVFQQGPHRVGVAPVVAAPLGMRSGSLDRTRNIICT